MFKVFKKSHRHRKHKKLFSGSNSRSFRPEFYYELFLFSTLIFVSSALLLQFLMSLQTALLLRYLDINFTYSLFGISFMSVSAEKWSEFRIFVVYGIGTLVFFAAGISLLYLLKKLKHIAWKLRLILVWIAFLMIHTLPMGMFGGTFFFEGFGMAYTWMFDDVIFRGILAFFALFISIFLRPFWMRQFLKTANSATFLSDSKNRKIFLNNLVVFPWIAGMIVLLFFVIYHKNWFWLLYLIGVGFVVLPLLWKKISHQKILIARNDKKIFNIRYPLPLMLLFFAILWVADYLSKINL